MLEDIYDGRQQMTDSWEKIGVTENKVKEGITKE